MRDAGIITRNLVILPTVSNISLANNGTHVSLGSKKLTACFKQSDSDFSIQAEKLIGDLAIKIKEHFLPLFVGTYSAAPYRIDYSDFHPEKVLGFLPHELDYTHLRMIWRRWKKKACISIFGHSVTPFGLKSIDDAVSRAFRTKGDFIPDYRLIDYLVSVMSTDRSPALDGKIGNEDKLKRDLEHLGVFDSRMSLYLLCRLRKLSTHGYTGFEDRHYSLFEDIGTDMAQAVNLQILVTALAFKYIFEGRISHNRIPDDPFIESERRQIFFCAAVGIPTFYVRENTSNVFLADLIKQTNYLRRSRRYRGYFRVLTSEYLWVLYKTILDECAELIEMMNMRQEIDELKLRLSNPLKFSALGKITRGILTDIGAKNPLNSSAYEFNHAAENYYRNTLNQNCINAGLNLLEKDISELDANIDSIEPQIKKALDSMFQHQTPVKFFAEVKPLITTEEISMNDLRMVIQLMLLIETNFFEESQQKYDGNDSNENGDASIHCQRYRTA
jgi:hypothetical protein